MGTRSQALEQRWEADNVYNCEAVVEGGRVVSLYNGSNVGINGDRWTREDYAATYDAFYQAYRVTREQTPESGNQPGLASGSGQPDGPQPASGGLLGRLYDYLRGFWEGLLDG